MAYGGAFCQCCGEDYLPFLTLDHRHGDGYKEHLRGTSLYRKLKREGWPRKKDFQCLCANCNQAKAQNANVCVCQKEKS